MFDGSEFPMSLAEDTFDLWLEKGRDSMLSYNYLLIIWDELDANYKPVYETDRAKISNYEKYQNALGRESLIAAYDLYSESRIT